MRNSRTRGPFFARECARKSTTANFASSEGWNASGPTASQRRAPLRATPRPGTSTRPSASSTASRSGYAARRYAAEGRREVAAHATAPTAIAMQCLRKKWKGSPKRSCPQK